MDGIKSFLSYKMTRCMVLKTAGAVGAMMAGHRSHDFAAHSDGHPEPRANRSARRLRAPAVSKGRSRLPQVLKPGVRLTGSFFLLTATTQAIRHGENTPGQESRVVEVCRLAHVTRRRFREDIDVKGKDLTLAIIIQC